MKFVLPVSRHSDCDLSDQEHVDQWQFIMDAHGVTDTICPEHGRVTWFDAVEFDSQEALDKAVEEWRSTGKLPE